MKHAIPVEALSAAAPAMAEAVSTCVHCGFCLPDCPTYRELGAEADSPRGRIVLMKEVLEGTLTAAEAAPHLDRCLGCLSCETSCPSGVRYGELLSPYRALTEPDRKRNPVAKLRRKLLSNTLPSPKRFRVAATLGRLAKPLRKALPSALAAPLDLVPAKLPKAAPLAPVNPPEGERRARVALLAGCAQQVLAPGINHAAVSLLNRAGVEVIVPEGQVCCGALAWHIGDGPRAAAHAEANLAAFPDDVDAVITTAAGCGSGLRDYPLILAGTAQQAAAESFAAKAVDIAAYLATLELPAPPPLSKPLKIAYHDACHLLHAQRVRDPPRDLLRAIPGVELIDLPDPQLCCGSAGTYNLDQPEIAARLGAAKAELVRDSGADLVATGNIGCLAQLDTHLEKLGCDIPVRHTAELLAAAHACEL